MEICTFASSSSGNCSLVSEKNTHLLIDSGISMRRISCSLNFMDLQMQSICGILITHEHSDHISGLKMISKYYKIPIYASCGTASELCRLIPEASPLIRVFKSGSSFEIGDFYITSFKTPHDTSDSVGYRLDAGRSSLAFLTDMGCVTSEVMSAVRGVGAAVLESNHDVNMLKSGRYPYYLKQRILSNRGHLSNNASASFASSLLNSGTRRFVLAHLSKENNTPALAYNCVHTLLSSQGASVGVDFELSVAPANNMGQTYII